MGLMALRLCGTQRNFMDVWRTLLTFAGRAYGPQKPKPVLAMITPLRTARLGFVGACRSRDADTTRKPSDPPHFPGSIDGA